MLITLFAALAFACTWVVARCLAEAIIGCFLASARTTTSGARANVIALLLALLQQVCVAVRLRAFFLAVRVILFVDAGTRRWRLASWGTATRREAIAAPHESTPLGCPTEKSTWAVRIDVVAFQ